MTALLARPLGATVDAIDVFCGFGGSSQGIHAAGADVRAAANHNPLAIECHAANFPDTDHWCADLVDPDSGDYMDAADLPAARFAWFSPGCTHHSKANAQKVYQRGRGSTLFDEDDPFDEVAYAKSERSRVTMSCVLRYCEARRPEILVVENVVEVCHWGPDRDGTTFAWWMRELALLGYEIEPLFLNSAFFPPCPQSRDRIYIVAWRTGSTRPDLEYHPTAYCTSDQCGGELVEAVQAWKQRRPSWPLPRWGKYGAQYVYACPRCGTEVDPAAWPAYTAIDWSHLGPRLGDRTSLGMKDLAPATVDRIRRGLAKFAGGPPIVIPAKSVWGADRPVTMAMSAQTTQQDKALVTEDGMVLDGVTITAQGHTYESGTYVRARSLRDSIFTQHTSMATGFAHMPFITEMRGGGSKVSGQRPVSDPAHTVTAGGYHHGLTSPALFAKFNGQPGDTAWHDVMADPFNTITGRDTTGVVVLPWVDQWRSNPVAVTEQLATVMTHMRHSLASIEPAPLESVTAADLEGVRFRMLNPDPELRRVMAFGDDYVLLGTKTQMTSGLGNAVTPPVASWITEQCMATLRGET